MKPQRINLAVKGDSRGSLVAVESLKDLPFEIRRVYYIYGTQPTVVRGNHAHRDLNQLAICVSGSCRFRLDDGNGGKCEVRLDSPSEGLLIRSMVWREMDEFSSDCVLLVLASKLYDEADYIRDYNDFLEVVRKQRS